MQVVEGKEVNFDLFSAMSKITEHFGENADLLVRYETGRGLFIRLRVFHNGRVCNHGFIIDHIEEKTSRFDVFSFKIDNAVRGLEEFIQDVDSGEISKIE